jgi:hypothetical protein
MTQAGTADYTLGTASYWDDGQMDIILDYHREDLTFEQLYPYPVTGTGGSSLYYEYRAERTNFEQTSGGTAIFYLQDGTGGSVGTASYSTDYLRGVVTFTTDQGGSTYYLTGRTFDLNAAAADIWRKKAGYYHNAFSFSTDNHRIDREAIYKHCIEMAETFEAMGQQSVSTLQVWRSDTDTL